MLIEQWRNGNIEARNKLVEHNMRLVSHILKKYYTEGSEIDDLVSAGTVGLIKGINSYKADKGVKLATYASRCIENEILMYFRGNKRSNTEISLSDAIDGEGDNEGLSIIDTIADDTDLAENIGNKEICNLLIDHVNETLKPREAKIIILRYGLNGNRIMTQKEVAKVCCISRSYVSRIEKRALQKLRKALGEEAKLNY